VALDAAAEPASMTVEVDVVGRRYVQDRDTAAVVSGDATRDAHFTERVSDVFQLLHRGGETSFAQVRSKVSQRAPQPP